jgi:hypothetical protein
MSKINTTLKMDMNNKTNKTNNADKTNKTNTTNKTNNADKTNKTNTTNKTNNADKTNTTNKTNNADKTNKTNTTNNADKTNTTIASKKTSNMSNTININKNDLNLSNLNSSELNELQEISNEAINNSLVLENTFTDEVKELTTNTLQKTKNKTIDIKNKSIEGVKDLFRKKSYEEKKLNKIKRKERKEKRISKRNKDKQEIGYSTLNRSITIIIITFIIILLIYTVSYYYRGKFDNYMDKMTLLSGVRDGKKAIIISQDPTNPNYIPIQNSSNVSGGGGAQFTYSFWFSINNMEYRKGEWKHMWHKGDRKGSPNRTPGVFLHPTKNSISIYLNTIKQSNNDDTLSVDDLFESVEIDDIPLKKWINMVIIFTENKKSIKPGENKVFRNALDIYINGFLKTRKELSSVPIFNNDDLWINMDGGFDGVIGKLDYYPRAITSSEVSKLLKTCPRDSQCGVKLDCPSYLNNNWWFNM